MCVELAKRLVIQVYELVGEPRDLRRGIARRLAAKQKASGHPGYCGVLRLEATLFKLKRGR